MGHIWFLVFYNFSMFSVSLMHELCPGTEKYTHLFVIICELGDFRLGFEAHVGLHLFAYDLIIEFKNFRP